MGCGFLCWWSDMCKVFEGIRVWTSYMTFSMLVMDRLGLEEWKHTTYVSYHDIDLCYGNLN